MLTVFVTQFPVSLFLSWNLPICSCLVIPTKLTFVICCVYFLAKLASVILFSFTLIISNRLIVVCLLYFSVTRSRLFCSRLTVSAIFVNKLVNRKLVSVVATSTVLVVLHVGRLTHSQHFSGCSLLNNV